MTEGIKKFLRPDTRSTKELAKEAKRRPPNYKCITAGNNPRTAAVIGPEFIELSAIPISGGPKPNGIGVHLQGNVIRGPTSIIAGMDEIQISGCWTLNPALMSCAPSSVASPIPTLVFSPPFQAGVRMVAAMKTIGALGAVS